jgi:DNA invertase Pin-like site-specific DNA recombinase
MMIRAIPSIRAMTSSGSKWRGLLDALWRIEILIDFMEQAQMSKTKTAAIYARYSSDVQKDRSIDDQIALCEQLAKRRGLKVGPIFTDRAKSAASMFERDGLLALMTAAKSKGFDFVIVETLSRLSRSQTDTPAIYERLKYKEIGIIDSNGDVTEVHVGVGGIVNSQFLKNLAQSVTRGRNARVREGLIPGRVAYGYQKVPGKPGVREINEDHAKIVRRIFDEYAAGFSTRTICERLMTERVISPSNTLDWNHQKLIGNGLKGGMLGNELYIGKLVWNNSYQIKNPETGKRQNRLAGKEDRIEVDVPHLRIISQKVWDAVQLQRKARRRGGDGPRVHKAHEKSRMIMPLLKCGDCGGRMMIGQSNMDGSPRVVCSAGFKRINCTHTKSYCLKTIEGTVLDGIKEKLTNRKALIEMTRAHHARFAEREKIVRADRETAQKQLNRVTIQIDRIVAAISDSDEPVKALVSKLNALETERAGLTEKVRLIEAEGNVVTLHPAAIERFSHAMEDMHAALTRDDLDESEHAAFKAAFYNVIERIVVTRTPKRAMPIVAPYARLSAIMGFEMFPAMRSVPQMLAEQGVSANRISSGSRSCGGQNRNSGEGLVPLGQWQRAA